MREIFLLRHRGSSGDELTSRLDRGYIEIIVRCRNEIYYAPSRERKLASIARADDVIDEVFTADRDTSLAESQRALR